MSVHTMLTSMHRGLTASLQSPSATPKTWTCFSLPTTVLHPFHWYFMLNMNHAIKKERKCPFSLVPIPLSPPLYLTPYTDIKQWCISSVLCSLSDPFAMVEFCTLLCILLSVPLREQGKKTTPDHVSTSYVSHYTQVKNHPYLDPMIVKRPKHFSLQKHNCVSESDMMRHKNVNGSGGLCTDNE